MKMTKLVYGEDIEYKIDIAQCEYDVGEYEEDEAEEGKKKNLTPQEALDLHFSPPDLESANKDDSDGENFEELPCDLQSEKISESDEVELAVPTVKCKKAAKSVYRQTDENALCSTTSSSAAPDTSEIDIQGQWEMTPADVVTPTDTEPIFSA
ncbi:hypothetical protein MRX96_015943 [Rhipicephalus microplus]